MSHLRKQNQWTLRKFFLRSRDWSPERFTDLSPITEIFMGNIRFKTWVFWISKLISPTVRLLEFSRRRFQGAGFYGDWVITAYTSPDGLSAAFRNTVRLASIKRNCSQEPGRQGSAREGRHDRNERKKIPSPWLVCGLHLGRGLPLL